MAKKNITFRIEEDMIEKLNELRGKTSQNAFLEQLITNFTSTSTSTSKPQDEVLVQLQLLVKAQEKLQAQVQLLAKPQVKEIIIEKDEDGTVLTEYIEEIPDFQKVQPTPEDFYGRVKTYEKGAFDNDPLKYLDEEEPATTFKPRQKPIEDDEPLW